VALLTYAVVTVDELKTYLDISGQTQDARLEQIANGVTVAFENETRAAFVQRQFTERLTGSNYQNGVGGAKRLFLSKLPIVSVASIVDDDGNTVAAADYTIEAGPGILVHDWNWPRPEGYSGRWTVTYTAGHAADTESVPADIKLLAMRTASFWFSRPNPGVVRKQIGPLEITYQNDAQAESGALPPDVTEGLRAYYVMSI
jgi:uncharacterized phiE125 gp8 family phage protein